MNQKVTIDVDSLRTAAELIKDTGLEYSAKITELYTEIDDMGASWSGQEYDNFKAVAEDHKEDLNKLATLLSSTIPDDLNIIATNYQNMKDEITAQTNSLK